MSPLGKSRRYTINLTAGEPYYLVTTDTRGTANGEPYIDVYRSDVSLLTTAGNYGSDLAVISGNAPVTGTYSLIIHDYDYNWTGNYSLTLTKVDRKSVV